MYKTRQDFIDACTCDLTPLNVVYDPECVIHGDFKLSVRQASKALEEGTDEALLRFLRGENEQE